MNLILEFHNNLTRAESPVRLPAADGFAQIFLMSNYSFKTLFNVGTTTFSSFSR
ncbi:hypothetical protein MAL08_12705 [Leptospira noguchii]|uniref:hypothetical protein n=1 Tax=Leptospira noguchii TaxID=28182 RepID=UPI001FB774CD|nr:hypothetical protein [Leptospira noguchii]UOG36950.1 hypothetical protein MAL08_12705 [Leptospira noguchii]